jgi:hypothetical protein
MAKRKSIMAVPVKWGQQERLFGETVKEGLDVLLGHRGSPFQRAVTFQDLLDTNVLRLASNVGLSTVTGNSSDFVVPTEDANIQLPPAPTGLSASGAFQNIILTWDLKTYVGHAFVEIHRHTSDSISDATLLARVSGFTGIYADAVGNNASYYYWVRAVNVNDDIGPFNSSTGVNGTTQPDIAVILDLLTGQITSSELATSLATQISDIDSLTSNLETFTGYLSSYSGNDLITRIGGLDTSVSTINSSITSINTSIASLNTATSNLQTSVSDLSANTADVYIQGTAPTGTIADNSRWYDTSDNNTLHIYFDSDGDGDKEWTSIEDPRIADNESAIATLDAEVFNADNTSRLATATALSATNTTVTNLNGTVSTLSTDVTSLKGVVFDSNGDSQIATTSALNSLTSDVEAIYDGPSNTSLVKTLQTQVTSLNGQVFNPDNSARLATASSVSTLSNSVSSQGSAISILQGDVTSLEAQVFDSDGNLQLATTSALSGLTSTVNTQGGSISTLQGDVTDLEAEVFNSNGTARLATGSSVSALSNTVSTQGGNISTLQTDVSDLEGAVFDSSGNVKLATTTALSGLTNEVEAIYDGTENPSLIRTIQTDVTDLEAQVFDSNGDARLATASALTGLTNTVNTQGGDISTLQTDVTDLESEVFDENGNVKLATTSALSGLSSTVSTQGGAISTLQGDVTDLNSAVFDANDNVKLASGSALTSLTNDVRAIYDSTSDDTIVGSVQTDISTLNSAVFDANNNVQLASASAVSALNNEVWGNGVTPSSATSSRIDALNATLTDPDTGLEAVGNAVDFVTTAVYPNGVANTSAITNLNSAVFDANTGQVKLASSSALSALETEVFGSGGASASRIDGIISTLYDGNGDLAFASATAFNSLNTAVTADGAISDKVDNIAAQMFVNGDTTGTLNLATAANLQTVTAEVFPDGATSASRLDQLSSAVWSGGNPNNDLILASADIVEELETAVFPDGSTQASSISTLQVQVQGEDGTGGALGSIQTLQQVVGDENSGLSSQYSVKLDNNGHVAGFGLSNTDNDGTPTSAFIIRADKFALVNPSATNEQTNSPANSTDLIVPFTVQANAILNDDGSTLVPAGVYMDTAFIRNGSITNAFIEDATIDFAKIASVDAGTISTGTLNTSRLNLDGTTLTSVDGVLQVGSLNANKITAGTISADIMEGTTVYANKLTGDVSVMTNFRDTTTQYFRGGAHTGTYGGTLKFLEESLDASSHTTVGHIPYAQASGWFSSTSSKTYSIKMYMKTASSGGSSTTVGTVYNASSFTSGGTTYYYIQISGNVTSLVGVGSTITSGNKSHTVTTATYSATSGATTIYYTLVTGSAFTTGNSISTTGSTGGSWTLVGETRVKATTNLYMPFSLSGTLGNRTTAAADMKLEMTRYGASGVTDADTGNALDSIGEVTGMIIGMR